MKQNKLLYSIQTVRQKKSNMNANKLSNSTDNNKIIKDKIENQVNPRR